MKKNDSKVSSIGVDKINFIIFYLKVILILLNLSVETTWLDIVAALLDILCKLILKQEALGASWIFSLTFEFP